MKFIGVVLSLIVLIGCASHKITMPAMDLPPEPQKPAVKSSVIIQNSIPWVCYSLNDSLKLYEYLLNKDSYEEKLRYRVESMNQLWQMR
jgi:hypothetical protein